MKIWKTIIIISENRQALKNLVQIPASRPGCSSNTLGPFMTWKLEFYGQSNDVKRS